MGRSQITLTRTDNNRPISPETDAEFLHKLKLGLLMALQEHGILSERQLHVACERLKDMP